MADFMTEILILNTIYSLKTSFTHDPDRAGFAHRDRNGGQSPPYVTRPSGEKGGLVRISHQDHGSRRRIRIRKRRSGTKSVAIATV
jgi:hypothetical protein